MCKYSYSEEGDCGNASPCQLQYYLSLNGEGDILPVDDDGYCIFHSKNMAWKQQNDFSGYLDKLFSVINQIDIGTITYETPWMTLAPNGLFLFDMRGIEWIANVPSDGSESTISISNFSFNHTIALNMNGGHFYDKLEINNNNDNLAINFCHSIFEKRVSLESSVLKEMSLEFCHFKGDFYMAKNCEIKERAEFYNMTVLKDFAISYSVFHGEVYFNGSTFGTDRIMSFDNVVFEDSTDFSDCIFNGYTTIESCQFDGEVIFIDSEFNRKTYFHSNEFDGNVYFKSNKGSNKMFNDIMYLYVKDENIGGVIHFENIDFLKIAPAERDNLLKLEKNNKIIIGSGCIKYRTQSPIITINSDQVNHNIITELTISFSNYFLYSEGFNLGVEFVSKQINNLQLFYYTDELISNEEFIERLKKVERDYWQFAIDKNEIDKSKQIQAIDNFSSKSSVLYKIAIRQRYGYWSETDTKELLKAISLNENSIDAGKVNLMIEQLNIYINPQTMKIEEVNVLDGGQAVFAERIGEINYNPHIYHGLSEADFNTMKDLWSKLDDLNRRELEREVESIQNNNNPEQIKSLKNKVFDLLAKHGIPIAHSLTASGIWEFFRNLVTY